MGGLTKCEHFAQAVRGGKGGRRGRKKGRKEVTTLEKGDQEESISDGSQNLYGSFEGENRNLVSISSVQVV
jgi:hypothetical protein